MNRLEARRQIVTAANRHRQKRNARGLGRVEFLAPPITMRHLHQAVAIVRHNRLVAPEVLTAAGFNKERAR